MEWDLSAAADLIAVLAKVALIHHLFTDSTHSFICSFRCAVVCSFVLLSIHAVMYHCQYVSFRI